MSIRFKKQPYRFDYGGGRQHHFGRCYISDYKKNYSILKKLHRKHSLRIDDFPVVFATSRGENWREQFIELWRIGMNVGIERLGANSYCFIYLGDDSVPDKEDVKKAVFDKRKSHPYTLFFLDEINNSKYGLTEDGVVSCFFTPDSRGRHSKGSKDQIHPTMNDLTKWGYIRGHAKRKITTAGKKVLNNAQRNTVFVCYKLHLNENRKKIRLLWSILRTLQGLKDNGLPTYPYFTNFTQKEIDFQEIIDYYNKSGKGKIPDVKDKTDIVELLDELKILYEKCNNSVVIKDNIFFSLTPSAYVKSGLSEMDSILNFKPSSSRKKNINNTSINKNSIWIISEEKISLNKIPSNSVFLSYDEWHACKEKLVDLTPQAVIILNKLIPGSLEASTGHILAYVKNGGLLIIHGPQSGRVGTNRQFYNWLPEDFERLNYLNTSKKWVFDNKRLKALPIRPIYCDKFTCDSDINKPISRFIANYGDGHFFFEGEDPENTDYVKIVEKYSNNKIVDFRKTASWIHRRIANLHRDKNILKEEHIYPIVGKEILYQQFGFRLSETFSAGWRGKGKVEGYVDLCTTFPAVTLWEIDSIKGKSGYTGGIGGDSIAIDQPHAVKCIDYINRAEIQFKIMCDLIPKNITNDVKVFKKNFDKEVKKLSKNDRFMINELLDNYLRFYIRIYKKLDIGLLAFILKLNLLIGKRPVISLLGASYGFAEGHKSSAREIATRNKYSLWTYRDLYEFLVRTTRFSPSTRRRILLRLLGKRSGPVYLCIAKIR